MSADASADAGADGDSPGTASDAERPASSDSEPGYPPLGPTDAHSPLEREVWATLDTVPDPHIPVSLVELAMVYDVRAHDGSVTVDLTFPCMGCPAYGFVHDDVRAACRTIEGVADVEIEVVWDPVWSKDMLDADAREAIRESGIAL